MKVVKYEIDKDILTVGFAESNFIVYTQLANDTTLTKQELLQKAYEQCKSAIDYEKTQEEHAFEWDGVGGEEFVPESPNAKIVELIADRYFHQFEIGQETVEIALSADVKDQYDETYDGAVQFATTYGNISENTLIIPSVTEHTEVVITAEIEGISDTKTIQLFPYIEPQVIQPEPTVEDYLLDLDYRISCIELGVI